MKHAGLAPTLSRLPAITYDKTQKRSDHIIEAPCRRMVMFQLSALILRPRHYPIPFHITLVPFSRAEAREAAAGGGNMESDMLEGRILHGGAVDSKGAWGIIAA